jgi:hypothetical protein
MYWILGGVLVVGALVASWFYFGNQIVYHRNLTTERFPWLIAGLATQMKDGGVLVIQHEGSPRFVQFVLSCSNPREACLGFGFPDAPWSRPYFEPVRNALTDLGYMIHESPTGDLSVSRFLELEIPGPLEAWQTAGSQVAAAAFQAMGVPSTDTFVAHLEGEIDSDRIVRDSLNRLRVEKGEARRPR